MRWLITFVIACVIFNLAQGWLLKMGLGRLPGDFRLRLGGREWYVPLGSSVLVGALMMLIGWLI